VPAVIDSLPNSFNGMFGSNASISDCNNNLLFYTNGFKVFNAQHDSMLNGTGLCDWTLYAQNEQMTGTEILQGVLIVPDPGNQNRFYLFHETLDTYGPGAPFSLPNNLYYTVIDMALNSGLGDVISKNNILLSDTLTYGKIHAVRHANGRDWWVVIQKYTGNVYYKFLVSPSGINLLSTQQIGRVIDIAFADINGGSSKFSPDGNKYATIYDNQHLEIYSFDRCSGLLYDSLDIYVYDTVITYPRAYNGLEWSSTSQFLYLSNNINIYQFDVWGANIPSSKILVATYDGFEVNGILPTEFLFLQRAKNNKIYITHWNGNEYMGVIDQPDQPGLACNVMQHSIQFPIDKGPVVPNHINYNLGAVSGSICDSLGLGIEETAFIEQALSVTPNPSASGSELLFEFEMIKNMVAVLKVFDVTGKKLHSQKIQPGVNRHSVKLSLPEGIYLARLEVKEKKYSAKFVVVK
jgi:hypothetical protein